MNAIASRKESYGELGPAMKNLPNDRWRAFCTYYILDTCTNHRKNNRGAQASAARKAGFGVHGTKPLVFAQIALRLLHDDRMIAAVAEESRKMLRAGAPEAVKALRNMVGDPNHPGHARAVGMLLDRTDPIETHQHIDVVHRHVDPLQEELEELRAARQLGVTREKLIELFGGNGLARLEALEAADTNQRMRDAKVIDGDVVEVEPEPEEQEAANAD